MDTAGQEEFSAMREQYMRSGEGFIVLYSVADRNSFDDVSKMFKQICRVKESEDYPMLIVGNKIDLENQRNVSTEEGRNLANSLGLQFVEASAKLGTNVELCFHQLVRIVRRYRATSTQDSKNSCRKKCILL